MGRAKSSFAQCTRSIIESLSALSELMGDASMNEHDQSDQSSPAVNKFDIAIKELQSSLQRLTNVHEAVLPDRAYGECFASVLEMHNVCSCYVHDTFGKAIILG